jgi:NTP pyrophosphatase (non-canonical NTP hydrolase)
LSWPQNAPTGPDPWSPTDWMTALAGEVGEAANLIKKRRRGEYIPTADIATELADVQAYLDLLADNLGIDLAEATRAKFNVVSERVGSEVRL